MYPLKHLITQSHFHIKVCFERHTNTFHILCVHSKSPSSRNCTITSKPTNPWTDQPTFKRNFTFTIEINAKSLPALKAMHLIAVELHRIIQSWQLSLGKWALKQLYSFTACISAAQVRVSLCRAVPLKLISFAYFLFAPFFLVLWRIFCSAVTLLLHLLGNLLLGNIITSVEVFENCFFYFFWCLGINIRFWSLALIFLVLMLAAFTC